MNFKVDLCYKSPVSKILHIENQYRGFFYDKDEYRNSLLTHG